MTNHFWVVTMEFDALASWWNYRECEWVCVCCLGDRNRTQVWSQRDFSGLNAHLAAVGLQYSVALCVPNYQVTSALPILYRVWEKKIFLGLKLKLLNKTPTFSGRHRIKLMVNFFIWTLQSSKVPVSTSRNNVRVYLWVTVDIYSECNTVQHKQIQKMLQGEKTTWDETKNIGNVN